MRHPMPGPRSSRPLWALGGAAAATLVFLSAGAAGNGQIGPPISPQAREILSHLSIVYLPDGAGGMHKTIRLSAANLQIVNGLGATNGFPPDPITPDPTLTAVNGLGNLFVGYRDSGYTWPSGATMEGSHNIVVGANRSSSFGGILGGANNTVEAPYGSVVGGSGAPPRATTPRSWEGPATWPRETTPASAAEGSAMRPGATPPSGAGRRGARPDRSTGRRATSSSPSRPRLRGFSAKT